MDGDTQVYLLTTEGKSDDYLQHVRQTGPTLMEGKNEILSKVNSHTKNSSSGDQNETMSESIAEANETESLDFISHPALLSPSTKSTASVPSFTHLSLDDPGSSLDLRSFGQQSPSNWSSLPNDAIRWQKCQSSWSLSMSTATTVSDSTWSSYTFNCPISRSAHSIPRLHNTQGNLHTSTFRTLRSQSESSVIETSNQLLWQSSVKYNEKLQQNLDPPTDMENTDTGMAFLSDLSDYSADSPSEANSPYRPPVLLGMGTKEEEEDPNAELPMMSTILERMPWHPDRAREFLHHYLNLAQQKGDHYKVQKLKQQLKYLTIRNKKRSYRNIATNDENNNHQESFSNNRWNTERKKKPQNAKGNNENWNSDQRNNSETWWRNGMKCNTRPPSPQWECPTPPITPYRMPPPLWNSILPRPIMRMPPFRPASQYCFRPLPIPPVGPPDPEWGIYHPGWLRPQPPMWNAYQPGFNNGWNPGKRIRPLGHAGGDIYGNRQERKWSPQNRKSGKF